MIRHVVLLGWRSDATDEQRSAARRGVESLPDHIPEIRSWIVGENSARQDPAYLDLAIIGEFDSRADYEVFMTHPYHDKIRAESTGPILDRAVRVQYDF